MSVAEPTKIANFAGGGGGSTLEWLPVRGRAPLADYENNQLVYFFDDGGDGALQALLKMPESRVPSKQVRLNLGAYSPSISDNFLLKAKSYLIRKDVDPNEAGANFHDSTNTALANVSPTNANREVSVDITDAAGQINGIEVQPGDSILIEVYRDHGNDTDTDTIRFVPRLTEVIS